MTSAISWTRVRWALYGALVALIGVGFFVRDSLESEEDRLRRLIVARNETKLYPYLASPDAVLAKMAATGLWQCWRDEKGATARQQLEAGLTAMNEGRYATAENTFRQLIREYPDWAEAINSQATLLYALRRPAESLVLCEQVVTLKPHHFGAWNGMALCAAQLGDWPRARHAVRQVIRLHPYSRENQEFLRQIERHIPALDV